MLLQEFGDDFVPLQKLAFEGLDALRADRAERGFLDREQERVTV